MTDAPGEAFNRIYDMPRAEALSNLRRSVEHIVFLSDAGDRVIDEALEDIAYTIHVIRQRIWNDETERNRAIFNRVNRVTHSPTQNLEDLI